MTVARIKSRVGEDASTLAPVVKDLEHRLVAEKLLYEDVHFERLKLRRPEERIGVDRTVVVVEKLERNPLVVIPDTPLII